MCSYSVYNLNILLFEIKDANLFISNYFGATITIYSYALHQRHSQSRGYGFHYLCTEFIALINRKICLLNKVKKNISTKIMVCIDCLWRRPCFLKCNIFILLDFS